MWELFNLVQKNDLSPNQFFLLLSIREKISVTTFNQEDYNKLVKIDYIRDNKITVKGNNVINSIDSYFSGKKSKSINDLLGINYIKKVNDYRELFPKGKLPSGSPSRNNVKSLTENFVWFFSQYDFTWDEVLEATKMYIEEYKRENYQYMQNSLYFISKQDKNKVKFSKLADYCDMIRDGYNMNNNDLFKDKIV